MTLSGKKETTERRRRRKQKEEEEDEGQQSDEEDSENLQSPTNSTESATVMVEDGVFTMTLGPASSKAASDAYDLSLNENSRENAIFSPSPRINAGIAVKHNVLYLYGGIIEDGDRQYTLSDFYSLDHRKLQEWKTLLADDLASQTWFDSSSDTEEDDNDSEDDESDNEPKDIDMN